MILHFGNLMLSFEKNSSVYEFFWQNSGWISLQFVIIMPQANCNHYQRILQYAVNSKTTIVLKSYSLKQMNTETLISSKIAPSEFGVLIQKVFYWPKHLTPFWSGVKQQRRISLNVFHVLESYWFDWFLI